MADAQKQPTDINKELGEIAERSQQLMQQFLKKSAKDGHNLKPAMDSQFDPVGISRALTEMTQRMLNNPAKLVEAQTTLWQSYMKLWETTTRRMMGPRRGMVGELRIRLHQAIVSACGAMVAKQRR